jgi:hypothetical protein
MKSRRAYYRNDDGTLSIGAVLEDNEGHWYTTNGTPVNPDGEDVILRGWPDTTVASCEDGSLFVAEEIGDSTV